MSLTPYQRKKLARKYAFNRKCIRAIEWVKDMKCTNYRTFKSSAMAEALDINPKTVGNIIPILVRQGLIRPWSDTSSQNAKVWQIVD
ncbi:MAG: hypothetical protein HY376_01930 [Candidatus Blackburnbacteria bacterium]|nr:hypothetical protein [Candidatus Blackburnbacteria bacterium]